MRFRKPLRVLALAFASVAVVATPVVLFAHARLVRSTPGADGTLSVAPSALELWFSERPEVRFTTLSLADPAGASVSLGAVARIAGEPMGVTAPITGPLGNGRYTVSWRTAAADGHPTTGKFSFVVAVPAPPVVLAADTPTVRGRQPMSNAIVEPADETPISTAVRWAELVALLTLVGTMIFAIFVVPGARLPDVVAADARDRARRLAGAVLVLFAVTTVWRLSAQADLLASASTARVSAMLTVARDTGWGNGWVLGAAGVLVAAIGLAVARRSPAGWFVAGVGSVAIAFSEGLTGHAAASKQIALAAAVDVSHVLGAGGWIGGLAAVTLCGLAATRRAEQPGQSTLSQQLIRSYHRSAVECVTVVLVTAVAGIGVAWYRLGQPTVFWSSAYGRVLLVKLAFALVLLGFGWFHWRTVVIPDWTDDSSFRFKRSVAFELLVGAGIVGVTAVLLSTGLTSH